MSRSRSWNSRWLLLAAWVALVAGCAPAVQPPAVAPASPVVLIHPLQELDREATLVVLPFRVPGTADPAWGRQVARLYQDVLLGNRAFARVRYLDTAWADEAAAVAAARRAGGAYVLAGRVTRVVAGSELGGGSLAVRLRLLETTGGRTLWYVVQDLVQPPAYGGDGLVAELRRSFSADYPQRQPLTAPVAAAMVLHSAEDLAAVLAGARSLPPVD